MVQNLVILLHELRVSCGAGYLVNVPSLGCFHLPLLLFAPSEQVWRASAVSRRAGGGLPPVHGPQCFGIFNLLAVALPRSCLHAVALSEQN